MWTLVVGVGNYYIVTSGSGTAAGDYRLAVTCPESAYNWHPEPMTCGTTYRGTTAGQGASQVSCVGCHLSVGRTADHYIIPAVLRERPHV